MTACPTAASTSAAELTISDAAADFGKHAVYLDWGCTWCSSGGMANVVLLPKKQINSSALHHVAAGILAEHGDCQHLEELAQLWAEGWSS